MTRNDFLTANEPPHPLQFTADGAVDIVAADAGEGKPKTRKFSMVAYTGGMMRVPLYYDPVVVDLDGLDLGASARPILIDHQMDLEHVLGQTDEIAIKSGKVVASGGIFGESEMARMAISMADKGYKFQASIGARVINREYVPEGSTAKANGKTWKGPINIARKSVLGEISFVVLGADDRTSASIAATAAERKAMSFQEWLAAMGLSIDGLTAEQKTKLQAKFDAEQKTKDDPAKKDGEQVQASAKEPTEEEVIQARRKAVAAESRRITEIDRICGQYSTAPNLGDLKAKAIEEGWSVEKLELALDKATRPKAPGVIIRGEEKLDAPVIEAALCMAGGMDQPYIQRGGQIVQAKWEQVFAPQVLEAADRRFRQRIGLQELLLEAAWANGYSGRVGAIHSDLRGVLQHAFGIQAAFSTVSLSGILSNTANKFLLDGYMAVDQAWAQIAAIRPVRDFKTVTSYRMTGALQYDKLAPDGEIKHGTLDEQSFTNKADTYAKMLAITRQDIVNDDLGAITQVPRRLGRGAGLKLNDVFWTAFLDNASFFAAGNSNYVTGAAYALSSAGLKKAVETFRRQTDADGKPLGISPANVLVPPELEVTADELYQSTNINTGGAATTEKVPNKNVFGGKYKPVTTPYLSNSSYTGYSLVAWYLLANPADLAVIEVAFLNGQQSPTIETAEADFNTLGVQMRGYHDFGVSKQDPKAGVKMKGEA